MNTLQRIRQIERSIKRLEETKANTTKSGVVRLRADSTLRVAHAELKMLRSNLNTVEGMPDSYRKTPNAHTAYGDSSESGQFQKAV